jgi:hypothetical protein
MLLLSVVVVVGEGLGVIGFVGELRGVVIYLGFIVIDQLRSVFLYGGGLVV